MKNRTLGIESHRNDKKFRVRITESLGLFLAMAIAMTGMLSTPAQAQRNAGKNGNDPVGTPEVSRFYKAAISPASVKAGSTSAIQIIITNCSEADCDADHATNGGESFKSGEIGIPDDAGIMNPPTPSSNPVWTVSPNGGMIELEKIQNANISPGESLVVSFTATVTADVPECESIFIEWPAFAYQDTQLPADNPYTLFGDQPLLEVQGICDTSADMPVNKLVSGFSAVCDDANTGSIDESGLGEGTGTFRDETEPEFDAERPCTYSNDNTDAGSIVNSVFLTLLDDTDPRFDINVYTREGTLQTGLPGTQLLTGDPFPISYGIKIPEQFDTEAEWETPFTMCEIQAAPYSLAGVTVMADGIPQTISDIYFLSGTLPGESDPRLFGCFNTDGPPVETDIFSVDLNNTPICTFTQGGYGQDRGNNTIGQILTDNFDDIFPDGVQVGETSVPGSADGYGLWLTTAGAVRDFLPQGMTPGTFTSQDYMNPTNPPHSSSATTAGVFAGQVTTLKLNVSIGDADPGVFPYGGGGIGDFLVDYPTCYDGSMPTVREVLADANFMLSGAEGEPLYGADCTISEMNQLVDMLNNSFDNCEVNPEASILRIRTASQD